MDSAQLSKTIAAGLGLVSIMVLAIMGKIDGATSLDALKWIVGFYIGGTAVLGSARYFAQRGAPAAKDGAK